MIDFITKILRQVGLGALSMTIQPVVSLKNVAAQRDIIINDDAELTPLSPGVNLVWGYDRIQQRMFRYKCIELGDHIKIEKY